MSNTSQPVRHLQEMLRTLSLYYPFFPSIIPNGVFNPATLEAVMLFQREFYPPVTGVVNAGTWNAIVALSQQVRRDQLTNRPTQVFPHRDTQIRPGDSSPSLPVIQTMFAALSHIFQGLSNQAPGTLQGEAGEADTRWLQRASGLAETGVLDQATWNSLSRLYQLYVTRLPGSVPRRASPAERE